MFHRLRERYHTTRSIRIAIDTYPDGICFAAADGRPILANKKINMVCHRLIGHTITNAEAMWRELEQLKISEAPAVGLCEDVSTDSAARRGTKEQLICKLPDGSVWQFQRQPIASGAAKLIQYEAADITELYQYRNRLLESNIRVTKLHGRQRDLLKNIVQNNLEKELLSAKMRIHDDFGRLLIMTRNTLTENAVERDGLELFAAWENVIVDMENATANRNAKVASPENELVQVADMIGCRVEFKGKQPSERKALLLLYAAIREALTNAVRHAGADKLTIIITEENREYHVEILNNGRTAVSTVQEGGGLGNLRRRLEQEGAAMDIRCENGVALILTIPKE